MWSFILEFQVRFSTWAQKARLCLKRVFMSSVKCCYCVKKNIFILTHLLQLCFLLQSNLSSSLWHFHINSKCDVANFFMSFLNCKKMVDKYKKMSFAFPQGIQLIFVTLVMKLGLFYQCVVFYWSSHSSLCAQGVMGVLWYCGDSNRHTFR